MLNKQSLKYFDVHTHAHFVAFEKDSDQVISRALTSGVWMMNVGTQKDTSASALNTAEKYSKGVYASVGLHPIHTEKSFHEKKELGVLDATVTTKAQGFLSRSEDFDYEYYKELALRPKVLAIGECGLDYYRLSEKSKAKQVKVFEQQIALAEDVDKPLMIHCRSAFSDLISILQSANINSNSKPKEPGIIHFFTGSIDDARKLLSIGYSFSFGGVITFTHDYSEQLRFIPLDRTVSETDAPYVTPAPFRGERNEPLRVIEVVHKIAEIKKIPIEKVRAQLVENALRILQIKD